MSKTKPKTKVQNQAIPATQKYSLQRRNERGNFHKVATLSETITPEAVQKQYGNGFYILRATKPRFRTIWKQQLGLNDKERFQALEKRTKYLTYSVAGVGVVEAIGFGATIWKFLTIDERLDLIEATLGLLKPTLNCVACNKPLDFFLQKHCSQCGAKIGWPRKFFLNPKGAPCLRCGFAMSNHQVFCPNCGRQRLIQIGGPMGSQGSWRPVPP